MAVVKLRKQDEKILGKLASVIGRLKGGTNRSEVLGLSLRFAELNLDEFLATVLKDLESEPILDTLRNPAEGETTDARRTEEYLYT